jgi:hypothetical protein
MAHAGHQLAGARTCGGPTTGERVAGPTLIVHHAISSLIAEASAAADLDPDRISFAKALCLIRRTATETAAIPTSALG